MHGFLYKSAIRFALRPLGHREPARGVGHQRRLEGETSAQAKSNARFGILIVDIYYRRPIHFCVRVHLHGEPALGHHQRRLEAMLQPNGPGKCWNRLTRYGFLYKSDVRFGLRPRRHRDLGGGVGHQRRLEPLGGI